MFNVVILGHFVRSSDEWKNVSTQDKKSIGLTVEDDGEYWYVMLLAVSVVLV